MIELIDKLIDYFEMIIEVQYDEDTLEKRFLQELTEIKTNTTK
tara:strand:+ start:1353 stop:1481 length:129 start_codon:yes stop_codon:yes gene_type:complete